MALALLVKAIESLKERGVKRVFIYLVVMKDFYEKLGFDILWECEVYVWD